MYMYKASVSFGLLLFGVVLLAFSGVRLAHLVGATWEFAIFASGTALAGSCCAVLQSNKRIDDLEKKISEIDNARKAQA
jgi:hypothetical protein